MAEFSELDAGCSLRSRWLCIHADDCREGCCVDWRAERVFRRNSFRVFSKRDFKHVDRAVRVLDLLLVDTEWTKRAAVVERNYDKSVPSSCSQLPNTRSRGR